MSTPVNEQVTAWIRRSMADITGEGAISRYELWHAVDGDNPERCETFYLGEDAGDADDIAQSIWDVAEHDAGTRSLGMKQRYVILAYRGDEGESDSRHPFTITGSIAGMTNFGGDTEAPNEKGMMAHFMRHDTQMHTLQMQLAELSAGRLMKENAQLSRAKERAENVAMEMFETHQTLLDRKSERDLEFAKELQKEKRHEEVMAMVLSMAPLLLAKLMGGQGETVGTLRDASVGKVFENLSEKELMGVIGALTPKNQLVVMELFKSYKEDRAQEMTKRPEVLRESNEEPDDEVVTN
jgi:hypothetical protein